ncbi:Glycoside hydrolase, 38 vacuolar alpha mannosidase [Rhizophlyctis rosea]|uniref:alpha-mannosidase n=1 Tax=Rhizophlyctis rosea TaxID=64517 RepID=A0AAD5SDU8_9FUNG|nr:Glycoside hydrolase, 38 vacuolar alpha mannosidase [Rhizophlyctis rosea]
MSSTEPRTAGLNTMQKHRNITIERLEKFVQEGQFDDVNLTATLWKHRPESKFVTLQVYSVPDLKRIPFDDAIKGKFVDTHVGESFGPTWSTHWFKVTVDVPYEFANEEVVLVFDSSSEAMIWSTDGEPLTGLTGGGGQERHVDYRLTSKAKGGDHFELYIEVASNEIFGAGHGGFMNPPQTDRYYRLNSADIGVKNNTAHALKQDLDILIGLVKHLPSDSQTSSDALYTANRVVNIVHPDDPKTVEEATKVTDEFFASRRDTGYSLHQITAVGNCHIDTAWLWPFDETKRKAARSWSRQIGLLDEFPRSTFAASQAQQFEWVESLYPELFKKMKKYAKDGRFIPIGGTWVEMDCNMPSGEALCRQFLYGQRYFESRFGARCKVFWLPDTFGYSAQLPQIVREADLRYFFTQKLSWNNINRFPHTSFLWAGLDGTSVLTHFSPADTYTAQVNVEEVTRAVTNNKDKTYSNKSLLLYGNGDGGGGPLPAMLYRLERLKNLQGLPATAKSGHPQDFYEELEKTSKDLVTWKGELYFELHRGTYTSQAKIKKGNRKSELLLRDVEILSALCCATKGVDYNAKFYDEIAETGGVMRKRAFEKLAQSFSSTDSSARALTVFNSTSWERQNEVVAVDLSLLGDVSATSFAQRSSDGTHGLVLVAAANKIGSFSVATLDLKALSQEFVPVTGRKNDQYFAAPLGFLHSFLKVITTNVDDLIDTVDGQYVLVDETKQQLVTVDNELITVIFDSHGRLRSFVDKSEGREIVAPGFLGNVFKIYEDIPLFWDAWDVEVYHLEKGWDAGVGTLEVLEKGPLRAVLQVKHPLTKHSTLTQKIIINARSKLIEFDTHVDWHENRKFLKVEFPVNITQDIATYETQFGYIQRPTHYNNSWDLARFEVCGHKFADFSEFGYGVALLNDCKYGYAVHGNVMRLSLLRSPKAPDFHADMGEHTFRYALYPHKGAFLESDVVKAGYEFNVPLVVSSASASKPIDQQYFKVDKSNLVLDTVKVAEDSADGKQIVLRFYEAYGGRGVARVDTALNIKSAVISNIMEDDKDDVEVKDGGFSIGFGPFKVITVKLYLA